MKILFLTPVLFYKGGIGRYVRYQLEALRGMPDLQQLTVLSLKGPGPGDFESPVMVDWAGSASPTALSRAQFTAQAVRYALKDRPTLVWAAHVNLGPLALRIARMVGACTILNVYGRELWSPGMQQPSRRRSLRAASVVVSDCHRSAEFALLNGLVAEKPTVIWDCVDLQRFTPATPDWNRLARYGIQQGPFRVLFLGRINADTRYKGTERLLDVAARLPEGRVEVVYAGQGNDIPHLQALAERTGRGSQTRFTGPVEEADLADMYRSADAFYLVSNIGQGEGEGIPLTPLEALACGVPVLVGNEDGSVETLDEGGGGWCGTPTDLTAQAEYIRRLYTDGDWHKSERVAARQRAEDAFGYPAFAQKTQELARRIHINH